MLISTKLILHWMGLLLGVLTVTFGAEISRHLDQLERQQRRFDHRSKDQIVFEEVVEESFEIRPIVNNDSKVRKRPVVTKQRGLVPQLWKNYTGPYEEPAEDVTCNIARMKCSYRPGCELALHNFVLGCMDLAKGSSNVCNSHCRHSLIALTSTHEGKRLMKCDCAGDEFCERTKKNVEVCKKEVDHATDPNTVVSCTAAQWICQSDAACWKALDYYKMLCKPMFRGKRCTTRCENSINILQRQKAAAKLETCYCDGTENFPCQEMKDNMKRLCFIKDDLLTNEIEGSRKSSASGTIFTRIQRWLVIICVVLGGAVNFVFAVVFQSFYKGPDPDA